LVAAVRGLCSEFRQAHGLSIDFVDEDVPLSIPADVALCLYRIAQEALRNVIKHSGARHARVELGGARRWSTWGLPMTALASAPARPSIGGGSAC
jgi:signal transduction histidine kinase